PGTMSESDDHTGVPDDDLLAAEYVLGVLERADRAMAARRIERDRAFARLVADWETRLAPWAEQIAPVAPPAAGAKGAIRGLVAKPRLLARAHGRYRRARRRQHCRAHLSRHAAIATAAGR